MWRWRDVACGGCVCWSTMLAINVWFTSKRRAKLLLQIFLCAVQPHCTQSYCLQHCYTLCNWLIAMCSAVLVLHCIGVPVCFSWRPHPPLLFPRLSWRGWWGGWRTTLSELSEGCRTTRKSCCRLLRWAARLEQLNQIACTCIYIARILAKHCVRRYLCCRWILRWFSWRRVLPYITQVPTPLLPNSL